MGRHPKLWRTRTIFLPYRPQSSDSIEATTILRLEDFHRLQYLLSNGEYLEIPL
jgi:hypothetical protein